MMAEAHFAGVPPHLFWDYTYRELAAVFAGENIRQTRAHSLMLWAGYQAVNLSRHKRLPDLAQLLRKLEPARVMSAKAIRTAVMGMAQAMGATVRYVKKGK